MSLKQFSTANRNAPEPVLDAEPITFEVDGDEWTATPPTGGQMALVLAAQTTHSTPAERVRGLVDFLDSVLDDNAQSRYRERLLDRSDPFEIEDVERIIEWLMEEWTTLPPTQQPDSPSSRPTTGRPSTAKRRSGA